VIALFLVNLFCMSSGEAMAPTTGEWVPSAAEPVAHLAADQHTDKDMGVCRICHARTHLTAVVASPAFYTASWGAGSWPLLAWQLPSGGRGDFLLRPP
jgi:hypothetical protein